MKYHISLIIFLLVLLSACQQATETEYLVLQGATIFDGNGTKYENGVIVIKGENIHAVGDNNTEIPTNSIIEDVSGKYIVPGFVDSHVHYVQSGFFDVNPSDLNVNLQDTLSYPEYNPKRFHEAYIRSGVTAVYEPGNTLENSIPVQNTRDSRIPHNSTTGPLINPYFDLDSLFIKPKSVDHMGQIIRALDSAGTIGIKIWDINIQDTTFLNILEYAGTEVANRGNKLVVHAMDLEKAKIALRAGAKVLVHSVSDTLIDEEFIQLAKRNEVIYCPTLTVFQGYLKAWESVLGYNSWQITDPNQVLDARTVSLVNNAGSFLKFVDSTSIANGLVEKKADLLPRTRMALLNLKKVYDAGIMVGTSTDAGNPGTLHGVSYIDELEAMQEAGIPAIDLITMSTRNGAMLMERIGDIGTLEEGKIADLVIMEKDPSVDISHIRTLTDVMHFGVLRSVKEKLNWE